MDASPLSFHTAPSDLAHAAQRGGRALYPLVAGPASSRYVIEEEEAARTLHCRDAPEAKVRIEHGSSFTAAAAHRAAEGSIFLDGVAQGPPFLDAARRVFNLDHHGDCVRQFTLSTCEQALVLVRRGLDLRERSWTLYANDPDLDTVLALWVLLNGMHIAANESLRAAVTPLVRVEGTLDVHGREGLDLLGLSPETLGRALGQLDQLRTTEHAARRGGAWTRVDPVEFTAAQLRAIDALLFPTDFFADYRHVEMLARIELSEHRVAVVCRSEGGIYEAEQDLKRVYGKRLGIVALQKEPGVYTLRQSDPFLPGSLERAYARLNVLDPAVRSGGSRNRWAGSAEIGGSPRQTGTLLSPQEIAEACRQAYRKATWKERWTALGSALAVVLLAVAAAAPAVMARIAPSWLGPAPPAWLPAFGMSVVGAGFLALCARKRPRLFGLRLPGGWDWLRLAPLALLAGAFGGTWTAGAALPFDQRVVVMLLFPLAAEITFRGVAHGILARSFAIQHDGGPWFWSLPALVSGALYAAVTPLLASTPAVFAAPWNWLLLVASSFAFGVAAALARERSGSLLTALLLHWAGSGLALLVASLLS